MTQRVAVLFGTETGNSQECAERLAEVIRADGIPADAIDLGKYDAPDLAKELVAFVVTSTFGNGDPPPNAEELLEYVSDEANSLAGVRFGVSGLGDSTYPLFAQCGRDFDERMEARGAERVVERVECDGGFDFAEPFEDFVESCQAYLAANWEGLVKSRAGQAEGADPVVDGAGDAAADTDTGKTRDTGEFTAVLSARHRLTSESSDKDTWHIEIDLGADAPDYAPGDCFTVMPSNDPAEVALVAEWLKGTADAAVDVDGRATTVQEALATDFCLHRIPMALVEALAAHSDVAKGLVGQSGDLKRFNVGNDVLDLLQSAPAGSVTGPELVATLRSLAPRYYSIASSSRAHPGKVHFTIDSVRFQRGERSRAGVASDWLCHRVDVGQVLQMRLHVNSSFHMPTDDRPIIMVGPGTGIAPFRSFLQELGATGASNPAWLFFGHRTPQHEFLYQEELQGFLDSGKLQRLSTAWSREGTEKRYVQNAVLSSADELWAWLESGATVYVCGDASGMAPDVLKAFKAIAQEVGNVADPDAWAAELIAAGRYCQDVY